MRDLFLVLLVAVGTAGAFATTRVETWRSKGSALPMGAWTTEGPGSFDGATLVHPGPGSTAVIREVDLPGPDRRYVATAALVPGTEQTRLFLVARCNTSDHRAASPAGGQSQASVALEVKPPCKGHVGIRVTGSSTTVGVGLVSVLPARRNPLHGIAQASGGIGFLGAGALATRRLLRGATLRIRIAGLAVALLLLVGVTLPGGTLDQLLLAMPGVSPNDLGVDFWVRPNMAAFLQKGMGHGLAFLLLGALARVAHTPPALAMARLAAFAVATEAVQWLVPARSPRVEDLIVDLAAGALGVALGGLVHRQRALRSSSSSSVRGQSDLSS